MTPSKKFKLKLRLLHKHGKITPIRKKWKWAWQIARRIGFPGILTDDEIDEDFLLSQAARSLKMRHTATFGGMQRIRLERTLQKLSDLGQEIEGGGI